MSIIDEIRRVLRSDHVSFAELSRIEGFSGGSLALTLGDNDSIVFWDDLSQEAVDALQQLIAAHCEPCSPLVYLVDGVMPRLPISKQARRYKERHWGPIVLRPGPRSNHQSYKGG